MHKPVNIVHLGNIGESRSHLAPGSYTRALADAHPYRNYFGVDTKPWQGTPLDNYRHLQFEFLEGLDRFPDNSISLISTQLALGYYSADGRLMIPVVVSPYTDPEESMFRAEISARRLGFFQDVKDIEELTDYTASTIELALRKLAPKKALHVIACPLGMKIILDAVERTTIGEFTLSNAERFHSYDQYIQAVNSATKPRTKLKLLRFKTYKPN